MSQIRNITLLLRMIQENVLKRLGLLGLRHISYNYQVKNKVQSGNLFFYFKKEIMVKSIKKERYKEIAECIASGQVPSSDIVWYFNDNKFYKWYTKNYRKEPEDE